MTCLSVWRRRIIVDEPVCTQSETVAWLDTLPTVAHICVACTCAEDLLPLGTISAIAVAKATLRYLGIHLAEPQ